MANRQVIINSQVYKLIPYGFCRCGCGGKTNLAPQSHTQSGWVKGEPLRFLPNHHRRNGKGTNWKGGRSYSGNGYLWVWSPSHPKAMHGYVSEHILVCEKALGKFLPVGAEPHHIDGNPKNNEPKNLVLCQDREYHILLEQRTQALRACGHANWRRCPHCKKWMDASNFYKKKDSCKRSSTYCIACIKIINKKKRLNKLTQEAADNVINRLTKMADV